MPAETGKKAAGSAKTPKAKNTSNKKPAAKTTVSDEDTAAETLKEPEKPLDPQEAKTKKEREGKVDIFTFVELTFPSPSSS